MTDLLLLCVLLGFAFAGLAWVADNIGKWL